MMDDWLEDPLMFLTEGSLSYRTPKSLASDACRKWNSFHFATRLKLEGSDHFCRLALGAASMPHEMGLPLLAYRQTKWYLDAFFFELMSVYDTLLQEMNVLYAINLDIKSVEWNKISEKLPSQVKELMRKEREAGWFKRLLWYRNTSTHHAYIPAEYEKEEDGDKAWDYDRHDIQLVYFDTATNMTKKENIRVACPDYLGKMLEHIHTVWGKMAEEFN